MAASLKLAIWHNEPWPTNQIGYNPAEVTKLFFSIETKKKFNLDQILRF